MLGPVVGDVVLDVVLGALGDDLRDGISIGIGLVVVDVEGDVAHGIVGHRLEHPVLVILERERELTFLERSACEHLLCVNNRLARHAVVVDPDLVLLCIVDDLRTVDDVLCLS